MEATRRARPLVTFTTVVLVIYVPIETWYSLPALWNPFYLVDFIGMVLLGWGIRCRRGETPGGLAVLAAGWAWEGANFWRALFGRLDAMADGVELRLGMAELSFVACGTIAALVALFWSLKLALSANSSPASTGVTRSESRA